MNTLSTLTGLCVIDVPTRVGFYITVCVCVSACVRVCVCVCVAEEGPRRVGGKLASLISRLIDCEKFEDDILRKRGGRGAP